MDGLMARDARDSPGGSAGAPARRGARDLLILLAGIAVAVAAAAPVVHKWLGNQPDQRLVDLEVYREGGLAVLRGAPLYDFLTQPPQLLPFTYPPIAAALAVPFTLLPWRAAQWAWTGLIYVSLVVVVCYAFRDLIRRTGRWAPLTVGVLVAATAWLDPVRDQVRFGQVGLFLLAICLADCCARTARWPRGMLVGLALAIKLVPGVFLIYFLVTGRRDALGNAVLTAVVATLGGFVLLPSDSSAYWFGALLEGGDRTGAVDGTTNQAIQGIVARVLDEGPARTLVWLALALVVAWFGFGWARRATLAAGAASGADASSLLLAGVAIVGLLSVVLSPVGWIHHLVWMIAVIGALVGDGRDTRRCLVALGLWLLFLFPVPWWARGLIGPDHSPVTVFAGQVLRDSFGIAALASIVVLGTWLVKRLDPDNHPRDPSQRQVGMGTLGA
ncbi:alpha-1,2-mannosyltransferase [Actinomadura luteofluorescens]|uniref:Alpha-1,2-mannosyltransferase n=2 Tax=Actinomadura luteofluorescens TaxID=46163 RepID=A0A7Y9EI16_9ACTN|nr:glycosyltransferase 87 family protein [Actinomadura luteofluorescens]NYD48124.1 alpha-1,2-mannosyltransferase [Actinomadura luteofluorescens]